MCKCIDECDCIRLSTLEALGPDPGHADPNDIIPDSIVPWLKNKKHEEKEEKNFLFDWFFVWS